MDASVRLPPVSCNDPPCPWTESAVCVPPAITTASPPKHATSADVGTRWTDGLLALVQFAAVAQSLPTDPLKSSVQVTVAAADELSAPSTASKPAQVVAATASRGLRKLLW